MEPLILQSEDCQLGAAAVYRLAHKGRARRERWNERICQKRRRKRERWSGVTGTEEHKQRDKGQREESGSLRVEEGRRNKCVCVTEGGRGSQTGSFQETKAMRWCGRWKAEGAKRRCHFATDSSCVSERDRG